MGLCRGPWMRMPMQVVLFDVLPMRVLPPLFFVLASYPMIGLRQGLAHMGRTALVSARLFVVARPYA